MSFVVIPAHSAASGEHIISLGIPKMICWSTEVSKDSKTSAQLGKMKREADIWRCVLKLIARVIVSLFF